MSKKAFTIEEIAQAVIHKEIIEPNHEFFTDFSGLRGEFEDLIVYNNLNVNTRTGGYKFNINNSFNKNILFLSGMRGSGKSSELAKIAQNIHNPDCFYCITCNIDEGLDLNDLEYMDILILQLELLTNKLKTDKISVNKGIIDKMQKWFSERESEIVKKIGSEAGFGLEVGASTENPFFKLISVLVNFKASVNGSLERATTTRNTLKNNFINFADLFNEFIEEVNQALRIEKKAQEVLFIIDGLEKTMTSETRRRLIVEEQNRISKIKAYTIFTLPIELAKERPNLIQFSEVESFPFIKILERNGNKIEAAYQKMKEFIYKRIDASLFENEKIVEEVIYYSGGSPRQLLQILDVTATYVPNDENKISKQALDKALHRLSNQMAQHIEMPMIEMMKTIKDNNKNGKDTAYSEVIQKMLESIYVMEYNSGTYKRPNPLLELTNLYKQNVGTE
jgi:hypothetical protein